MSFERTRNGFTISTDKSRLDVRAVHEFLSERSYWAQDIPFDVVRRSIENSLCFGVYDGGGQVGFARVITDFATFAYIADVFILEGHRGRGLSKWLVESILAHPDLQGLRRWMLATRDAHELYGRFGFQSLGNPERFMTIHSSDTYKKRDQGT